MYIYIYKEREEERKREKERNGPKLTDLELHDEQIYL